MMPLFTLYKLRRNRGQKPGANVFLWLAFSLLSLTACAHEARETRTARIADLTHSFDETTIYWPKNRPFRLEHTHRGLTPGGYWYESGEYSASEHGGTHLDAPAHFADGGWHNDEIPLERLMAPGILVDVSKRALGNPDYAVSVADLREWEEQYGAIPAGTIVLVRTGWEEFWPDKARYLGSAGDDASKLHFPGFSEDAARFLAQERRVASVGLDTASLDPGTSQTFIAHRVFGAANIPGFENLRSLRELPAKGFRVVALPMKIRDGSGGPLRIVAELP